MEQQPQTVLARVTAVHRERYQIQTPTGETYARLKTGAYRDLPPDEIPTVGDFVDAIPNPAGDALIIATRPRASLFRRVRPGPGRLAAQAVAANFDSVLLLSSLNQEWNPRRVERYAAQAWDSGATPVLVLTKADLCEDPAPVLAMAEALLPGVDIYVVSAKTCQGLTELSALCAPGKTLVLLGSSGVGKSSLVNALAGESLMDTGEIREDDARGRHTTTHRQLLTLPSGAQIIDTPGMRELGLWDAEDGLAGVFHDIESLAGQCRFTDCAHKPEPGCAVRQAVEAGILSEKRLIAYLKLQREAARKVRQTRARHPKRRV